MTTVADAGVAARMFDARQALETKERERLTLEELGRRIAAAEGRAEKPYAAAVVKRWLEGDAEPGSMATWRAIASVFGVRVGWLANGELPMRDNPGDEGEQGAKPVNGNPRPRHPIVETKVQYLDPRVPTQPSRAKPKDAPKKPGRSAVA